MPLATIEPALILESITDAFYFLDREWRFRYVNQRALNYSGRTVGQLMGQVIWDLYPEMIGNKVHTEFERAVREQKSVEFEHHSSITGRWVEVRAYPSAGGLAVYFKDITEQRLAQERLLESEERFRIALRHLPLFVSRTDAELRYIWAHNSFLGLRPEELIGRTDEELLGADAVRELVAFKREVLAGGAGDRREIRVVAGGEVRLYDVTAEPLRKDGAVTGLTVSALDITDRKLAEISIAESEAKFRQLANALPQLAWLARPDGSTFWYNDRWYEYTGTTLEEVEGWRWQSVLDPELLPGVLERWQASIDSGEPFDMTFPLRGADGVYRPFLTRIVPVRDERGVVRLWVGTHTDVSEQRRIAEERQQLLEAEQAARAEAERVSRMKDEFLSVLSHELRTPLQAIVGWSQVLESRPSDPEALAQGIAAIARNARAQARLVEDLLEMSRIISGKLQLEIRQLDLRSVIDSAIEAVLPNAHAKGLRVEKSACDSPVPVAGDPLRLRQAVWNLLSNAVKFTPHGGEIRVRVARTPTHGEVSVSDSGEGIPAKFLPYIFDRFRQADASSTRAHGGLGLGLSLVKQLVEMHGGTVHAASDGEGAGASFTIRLPMSAASQCEVDPARPFADISESLRKRIRLANVKVLVVEDQPDARAIIQRILEEHDASVHAASSADEAFAMLKRVRPDVLVSDISMPGADGYELIRWVRDLPPEEGGSTPAVALTAFARPEDERRAQLAGYQLHVAKPVEPREIVAVVATLAGRLGQQVSGIGRSSC